MMNTRITELINKPELIQETDLKLLTDEIKSRPYMQSLRALHLLGVSKFSPDQYQLELSRTAAFTTDKKILYQLINGKAAPVTNESAVSFAEIPQENAGQEKHELETTVPEMADELTVQNRITDQEQTPTAEEITQIAEKTDQPASEVEEEIQETVKEIPSETSKTFASTDSVNMFDKAVDSDTVSEEKEKLAQLAIPVVNPETKILDETQIGRDEVQPTSLTVKGERNRILFEGEENFLNEQPPAKIDIEMTKEAGKLVTEKAVASAEAPTADDIEALENKEKKEEVAEDIANAAENFSGSQTKPEITEAIEQKLDEKYPDGIKPDGETAVLPADDIEVLENIEKKQEITGDKLDVDSEKPVSIDNPEQLSRNSDQVQNAGAAFTDSDKIQTDDQAEDNDFSDSSQVSFSDVGGFLDEVKMPAPKNPEIKKDESNKPALNRHEIEMRRLIEEVEQKIKAKKAQEVKEPEVEDEPQHTDDVNFQENHDVVETPSEKSKAEPAADKSENENSAENTPAETQTATAKQEPVENSGWKPMNFAPHQPDSVSEKEISMPENGTANQNQEMNRAESADRDNSNEVAVQPHNGEHDQIKDAHVEPELVEREIQVEELTQSENIAEQQENSADISNADLSSNVPKFINTWQNWLKIDRPVVQFTETVSDPEITVEEIITEPAETEKAPQQKEEAIEKFIENEPKISQFKEDGTFVVREKSSDISHLMTETLANIYTEQKLYSKAINGFRILMEKHPEKKAYFEQKIAEVKEIRSKPNES